MKLPALLQKKTTSPLCNYPRHQQSQKTYHRDQRLKGQRNYYQILVCAKAGVRREAASPQGSGSQTMIRSVQLRFCQSGQGIVSARGVITWQLGRVAIIDVLLVNRPVKVDLTG